MRISIAQAQQLLSNGQVVAIPTETVYGLAAIAANPEAVDKVYKLKGRPANNPLIIHVAHATQVVSYLRTIPEDLALLARHFWPGPMTLVLEVDPEKIPNQIRAGLPTAAFRVPQHSLARALLEWAGPLVMPSANRSGSPSSTRREHVETDLGKDFPVLDGGPCGFGMESTILTFRNGAWQIIRLGVLPAEAFEAVLGYKPKVAKPNAKKPLSPGQLYRHYAPKAKLHLATDSASCAGIILGYSDRTYPMASQVFYLGASERPQEVAENLYNCLRQLDIDGIREAWVDIEIPTNGLWSTILERLQRGALGSGSSPD